MNGYRSNVRAMDMDLNCYVSVLHMKQENRRRLAIRYFLTVISVFPNFMFIEKAWHSALNVPPT